MKRKKMHAVHDIKFKHMLKRLKIFSSFHDLITQLDCIHIIFKIQNT